MGEEFMPGLRSDKIGTQPTSLLINGKGVIIDVSWESEISRNSFLGLEFK